MTVIRTSRSNGRIAAGENDLIIAEANSWPDAGGPVKPPLVFCHGVLDYTDTQQEAQIPLFQELAKYFTVCYADLGGDQWGNTTHVARIEAARVYLANTWGSTGPLTLVGVSMGTIGSLNYMKAYPTNVRAVAGLIPALDIQDLRNNRGLAASVDAAHPPSYNDLNYVTSPQSCPSPVIMGSFLSGSPYGTIPVHLFPSSTDSVAIPSSVVTFCAVRPQTMTKDCGTGGHSSTTIYVAIPYVVQFVRSLQQQ